MRQSIWGLSTTEELEWLTKSLQQDIDGGVLERRDTLEMLLSGMRGELMHRSEAEGCGGVGRAGAGDEDAQELAAVQEGMKQWS